jgi:hypothetical protein
MTKVTKEYHEQSSSEFANGTGRAEPLNSEA